MTSYCNITPTISGLTSGQATNFYFIQDATGGRTITWPSGWTSMCQPSPLANASTNIVAFWTGSIGVGQCGANGGPSVITLQAAPGAPPPSGYIFCWADSTGLTLRCENSSSVYFSMSKELTSGQVRAAGGANSPDTGLTLGTTGTDLCCTLSSGLIPVAVLPEATSSTFGTVKPDNSTITISAGVISSTGGGGATFTDSYIIVPYDFSPGGNSYPFSDTRVYCFDKNEGSSKTLTNGYGYINGSTVPSSYIGVALYSSAGNLLTATTSTGAATANGAILMALGGGAYTYTPGTAGRLSVCVATNAGTSLTLYANSSVAAYAQPSGNPVIYSGSNSATFTGSSITWPSTIGTKSGANAAFPWILLQ